MVLNDQPILGAIGGNWYAIYTRSRCEKKVAKLMTRDGIQVYLPLRKTIRQWSDRKRLVEVPLFNSYLFVYSLPELIINVLQVDGAVYVVKFSGKPAIIPETQIENLKILLNSCSEFDISTEDFIAGERVEITEGALCGINGVFVEYRGKKRVLIRLDALNQNLVIEVKAGLLHKKIEKS